MTVFSATVLLFLCIDPVGNIPFFLSALKSVDQSRRQLVVARELLIALVVMVLFLFAGQYVLQALQISEPTLTISGGIVLFLIAIKMIFPSIAIGTFDDQLEGEPFIVPLAIPFVAGPSALAASLFIMSRDPARWPQWLLALFIAWTLSGVLLFLAGGLSRYLGQRGMIAIERLMGMVLTTIAVQMLMTGILEFQAS